MDLIILKKKFFLSTIIKLTSSIGVILFNFYVVYLLDKSTLGVLNSAISLVVFLSIFTKFGLNLATLRFTSIFFEDKNIIKIYKLILQTIIISGTISSLITIFLIYFENEIVLTFYKSEEIRGVLKIFAISLPLFTFLQIQKSIFKSIKKPELSNLSDIGSILFLTCLMTFFFKLINLELTVFRVSLFFLFSNLSIFSLNNFILFYIILEKSSKSNTGNFKISNTDLIKKLPDYFSIDFVNFMNVWGIIFLFPFFYDFSKLGFFSSIYWLSQSLLFFPLILNSIYAPYFAINLNNNNNNESKKLFKQNRNISLIISLPIFLILFFFTEFFLDQILNINSIEFNAVFKILLINSLIRIIFGPQNLFLSMSNSQKQLKFILILSGVFQILVVLMSFIFFDLITLCFSFLLSNLFKHLWLRKTLIEKFKF